VKTLKKLEAEESQHPQMIRKITVIEQIILYVSTIIKPCPTPSFSKYSPYDIILLFI